MGWVKSFFFVVGRAFGPIGTFVGAVMTVLGGWLQVVFGTDALGPLSREHIILTGISLFVVGGAALLLRLEWRFREIDDFYGNEEKKALWKDGIFPTVHEYISYINRGDYGTVNRFWRAGLVNIGDGSGRMDLHTACESGNAAIARGIVERGGDPKRPDRSGRTPLMYAASRGHIKVVEILLEHDCAIDARSTDDGVSSLYAAAANGHGPLVDLLIRSRAKLDSVDADDMTPLMASIAQRHWEIAQMLMDAGAGLKRVDSFGATLADYAEYAKAPDPIRQRIRDQGVGHREPRIKSGGSGHSGTGKVRVHWKQDDAAI